jgi:phenylalanine ammonia-lyase
LDGQSLTVAGVTAAARYGAAVALDQSPETRERMAKSRDVLVGKVQANKSVYGISTGLGGSGACHSLISRVQLTKKNTMSSHF